MDEELEFLAGSLLVDQDSSRPHELRTSPLFTRDAFVVAPNNFPHRGLLGTVLRQHRNGLAATPSDPRIYINTQTPSSAVVCGVQGSGKSHTVSCLLEASLIQDSRIGTQPEPLAALVFHFDEEHGGRPCEAAYLSMPTAYGVAVRDVTVLVSPSNLVTMTNLYKTLPNVRVRPLYLRQSHLNAARMLSMMGCDDLEAMPLYMTMAISIIREMGSDEFTYLEFKRRMAMPKFNKAQKAGIEIRTRLLDSYISEIADDVTSFFGHGKLVVVDLSDPFLAGETAALLFDLVLGLFVEWETSTGKILVLDEAHKYLTGKDSGRLTKSVSSLIRQQRHLGMRIIVSTQEPTVIPGTILDLSSFIICHKFSSPAWCRHLEAHVSIRVDTEGREDAPPWFDQVMQLRTGQALVFSSGALGLAENPNPTEDSLLFLSVGYMLIHTRPRITMDGGSSVLAGQTPSASSSHITRPVQIQRLHSTKADPEPTPETGPSTKLTRPTDQTIAPDFLPLSKVLSYLHAEGIEHPAPSLVFQHLASSFDDLAAATRCASFNSYIIAARQRGVIELSHASDWDLGWVKLSTLPKNLPGSPQAIPKEQPLSHTAEPVSVHEPSGIALSQIPAQYDPRSGNSVVLGSYAPIILSPVVNRDAVLPSTPTPTNDCSGIVLAVMPGSASSPHFPEVTPSSESQPNEMLNTISGKSTFGASPSIPATIPLASSSLAQFKSNALIPRFSNPHFSDLVDILEQESAGKSQAKLQQSQIAALLLKKRPDYLSKSGLRRWKQFALNAELEGLIELGSLPNGVPDWISLRQTSADASKANLPSPSPVNPRDTPVLSPGRSLMASDHLPPMDHTGLKENGPLLDVSQATAATLTRLPSPVDVTFDQAIPESRVGLAQPPSEPHLDSPGPTLFPTAFPADLHHFPRTFPEGLHIQLPRPTSVGGISGNRTPVVDIPVIEMPADFPPAFPAESPHFALTFPEGLPVRPPRPTSVEGTSGNQTPTIEMPADSSPAFPAELPRTFPGGLPIQPARPTSDEGASGSQTPTVDLPVVELRAVDFPVLEMPADPTPLTFPEETSTHLPLTISEESTDGLPTTPIHNSHEPASTCEAGSLHKPVVLPPTPTSMIFDAIELNDTYFSSLVEIIKEERKRLSREGLNGIQIVTRMQKQFRLACETVGLVEGRATEGLAEGGLGVTGEGSSVLYELESSLPEPTPDISASTIVVELRDDFITKTVNRTPSPPLISPVNFFEPTPDTPRASATPDSALPTVPMTSVTPLVTPSPLGSFPNPPLGNPRDGHSAIPSKSSPILSRDVPGSSPKTTISPQERSDVSTASSTNSIYPHRSSVVTVTPSHSIQAPQSSSKLTTTAPAVAPIPPVLNPALLALVNIMKRKSAQSGKTKLDTSTISQLMRKEHPNLFVAQTWKQISAAAEAAGLVTRKTSNIFLLPKSSTYQTSVTSTPNTPQATSSRDPSLRMPQFSNPAFPLLINILRQEHVQNPGMISQEVVLAALNNRYPNFLALSGFKKWKKFALAAQSEGLIEFQVLSGGAGLVSLRPGFRQ